MNLPSMIVQPKRPFPAINPMTKPSRRPLSKPKKLLFAAIAVIFCILALEGLAHVVTFCIDYPRWLETQYRTVKNDAQRATHYDPQLGWALTPNIKNPDYFGKGIAVTINSQGFRAKHDYATAGRRIVMVGDSFTFGHGVADHETFPAALETAGRIETVNAGVMGYGIDQAYINYLRIEPALEHQVVLFGIITDDFRRLLTDRSGDGTFKPQLAWRGGKIATVGVPVRRPVPEGRLVHPEARLVYALDYFALTRLVPFQRSKDDFSDLDRPNESGELAEKIFLDLNDKIRSKGRRMGIVWFPSLYELTVVPNRELLNLHMSRLKKVAAENGIALIDLTGALPGKTEADFDPFYINPKIDPWRHPSARGHAAFAQAALPQVRALMDKPAAGSK